MPNPTEVDAFDSTGNPVAKLWWLADDNTGHVSAAAPGDPDPLWADMGAKPLGDGAAFQHEIGVGAPVFVFSETFGNIENSSVEPPDYDANYACLHHEEGHTPELRVRVDGVWYNVAMTPVQPSLTPVGNPIAPVTGLAKNPPPFFPEKPHDLKPLPLQGGAVK